MTKHHRQAQARAKQAAAIRTGTDAARASMRTTDSFVNFGARVGFGAGSQQDGGHFQIDFISRNPYNLEAAYRSNWVCGMVVDVVAQDMTRAGIEFQSDKLSPDDGKKMQGAIEKMRLWEGICNGLKWSRLYGGAIVVMLIDGQDLSTPLKLDSIGKGQFKGLLAFDRWQITPDLSNPVTEFGPDLGRPKYYTVTPAAQALIGSVIHYSRVVRVDGLELPWRQRLAENGWGQSVLERLWDRVVAFDSTTEGAAQLVFKAHLRTLKIPGFREIIAAGGKAAEGLAGQLSMMRQFQTNEGLTVIDGADEFDTHAYTFAGLSDMLLQFGQQLAGATQIPLVRLFGQSPAGMNSTGESDLITYYDGVSAQQDQKIRPGLSVVLDVLHRSEMGAPLPVGFEFEFVPLWQMTAEEKANVAKTTTDAVVAAEGAGIISPATAAKELRQSSRTTGVFTHISDEDINALDEEPPAPDDVETGQDPTNPAPKLEVVK